MTQLIVILLTGVITENIVFSQSMGICPYLGVSKKTSSALGMGLAVIFVIVISTLLCRVLFDFLLAPLEIVYLQTVVFVLVIASLVQLLDILLRVAAPTLYNSLGVYLALITTNCAVLGTANAGLQQADFLQTFVYALATGLGFTLALLLMAGVRERLERNNIPAPFRGFPITLLAAGIMAMAFAGFGGLDFFG